MGIFWISFKGAAAWPCALTANPHSNIQGNAKCFFIFHLTRANVLFPREGPGPTNPRPSVFFSLVLLSDSGHSVGRSLMRQPENHLKTRYFFAGGNQSCEGGKFQSRGPQPSQPYIRPRTWEIVFPIRPVRASRDTPPTEPHAVIKRPFGPAARPLSVRSSTPPLHSTGKLMIGFGSL